MNSTALSAFKFGFPRHITLDALLPLPTVLSLPSRTWVDVFDVKQYLQWAREGEAQVVNKFWLYTWHCLDDLRRTAANTTDGTSHLWPTAEQLVVP